MEKQGMLVLARRVGEKIRIDGDVVLTILEIDRGKVRVGIAAPAEVTVHREEVHQAIQEGRPPRCLRQPPTRP